MATASSPGESRPAEETAAMPVTEMVARLRETLGAKLVAYVGSVRHTRVVSEWTSGHAAPSDDVEARLRAAFRVSSTLLNSCPKEVIQVWFQATNELLEERAPARVLREDDPASAGRSVLAAARLFVT